MNFLVSWRKLFGPFLAASEVFWSLIVECRLGCGACCIAPSINSPLPGMPQGKKAGERCAQLTDDNLCAVFGMASRPALCDQFKAEPELCGDTREHALEQITLLEIATR